MQDLIDKIQELRKNLAAMKPKGKDAASNLVPAIQLPTVKPLSISSAPASSRASKLPGMSPASTKDPKKMAEQLKDPKPKKPKVEVLKFDANGQWSLDKAVEDRIGIGHSVSELKGKGVEYLVHPQTGEVRAKFFNGNMIGQAPASGGADEPTKTLGKFGENNSV